MTGKRKRHGAGFKARVASEALRGEPTTAQLATKHAIHQCDGDEWKKQAMAGVFSAQCGALSRGKEAAQDAKFGRLVVERNLLAKASGR